MHRVLQGAPGAAGQVVVGGGHRGQGVEEVGLRPQAGAGGEHVAPVLGLALVDPQEAVAHGHVEVGCPQVGPAAELAVPAVGVLVGQEVAIARLVGPALEVVGADAVLGRLMVFQPDARDLVGEQQQEVVVVVMMRPVEFVRLLH